MVYSSATKDSEHSNPSFRRNLIVALNWTKLAASMDYQFLNFIGTHNVWTSIFKVKYEDAIERSIQDDQAEGIDKSRSWKSAPNSAGEQQQEQAACPANGQSSQRSGSAQTEEQEYQAATGSTRWSTRNPWWTETVDEIASTRRQWPGSLEWSATSGTIASVQKSDRNQASK